jgi:enoyl-CoA hydratase
MKNTNLILNIKNRVLSILINRETTLNTISLDCVNELVSVFHRYVDDNNVRAIIITGKGDKAFSTGADIKEFLKVNPSNAIEFAKNGQKFTNLIENYPKPVIAAVNGYALGGGCELAMACHLRYVSKNAVFGLPEVKLGIIPGYGGTQRMIQYLGKTKALEFLMLGKTINADEALRLGLINEIVDSQVLLDRVQEVAESLATLPFASINGIIKSVNSFHENINAFNTEIQSFSDCISTQDFKEGVDAFIQKRKPNFK